jgi:creatinine amidohydrolase
LPTLTMRLHLLTWPAVAEYLENSAGILVPIGSTEQHGPTGLLGTDALCAEAVAVRAGEIAGALVAPTLHIGMAQHHMGFAGTITLRPSTLIALIGDVVSSLAEHGFRRILFVNGHGGNVATLGAAFAECFAAGRLIRGREAPDLRLKQLNWYDMRRVREFSATQYGRSEGQHATPSEIALTQALFPQTADHRVLEPQVASSSAFHDWRDYQRRHPDGRMGSDPSLARPEHGSELIELAAQGIANAYSAFVSEE